MAAASHFEMMVALLLPESQGELTLASSDYRLQPSMNYNYLAEPFDRERLRAGIRLALESGGTTRTGSACWGDASNPRMMTWPATTRWISGCCGKRRPTRTSRARAGWGHLSDPLAVVDQFGNVHGMEGLRIVDASIMPDLVRAPINPAVIMLAERVADFINGPAGDLAADARDLR